MTEEEDDQAFVASVLASLPPPRVSEDFLSRLNARIDGTAGWFGLTDFRVWTLRLAPAAAALALLAVLWPGTGTSGTASARAATIAISESFSPARAADWQQEVSADALLDAALQPASGGTRVR